MLLFELEFPARNRLVKRIRTDPACLRCGRKLVFTGYTFITQAHRKSVHRWIKLHSGQSILHARNVVLHFNELLDIAGRLDSIDFLLKLLAVCLNILFFSIATVSSFISLVRHVPG